MRLVYAAFIGGTMCKLFESESGAWEFINLLPYLQQCDAQVIPMEVFK